MILDRLASPAHREKHERHHAKHAPYGTHAYRWAKMIAEMCDRHGLRSVLDYGAGKRTLAPALCEMRPELQVTEYDPCVPEIAALPKPADLVVCVDVLIFVEEDKLETVLNHLAELATKRLLVNVPFHPVHKLSQAAGPRWFLGLDDSWWLDRIEAGWPNSHSWTAEAKDSEHTRYLWCELWR